MDTNFLGIPAIGATAYAAPSITATSDGVLIAAEAASRLQFWSSTDSGNTWNSESSTPPRAPPTRHRR